MDFKTLRARLVGEFPLVMHNGQLADPMNKFAREMRKITDKRASNMTDADRLELSRLEFLGSLYMGKDGPILTADMIAGAIIEGAKRSNKGKKAKAGISVDKNATLIYDGPKDPKELFEDDIHRLSAIVKNPGQTGRFVRTRPIFPKWSADIEVKYQSGSFDKDNVLQALHNCGEYCGIGDGRPRYGRFVVVEEAQLKKAA